jgi:hypothetical protein
MQTNFHDHCCAPRISAEPQATASNDFKMYALDSQAENQIKRAKLDCYASAVPEQTNGTNRLLSPNLLRQLNNPK